MAKQAQLQPPKNPSILPMAKTLNLHRTRSSTKDGHIQHSPNMPNKKHNHHKPSDNEQMD